MDQRKVTDSNGSNLLKWWYTDITDYRVLQSEEKANLIGMTFDGTIIREEAKLQTERQLVLATLSDGREFYLAPNQWVLRTREEYIKGYWIVNGEDYNPNDPIVEKVLELIDAGLVCQVTKAVTLFGKSPKKDTSIASREVKVFVPINQDELIINDGMSQHCSFVSNRETDETYIRNMMLRIR